MEETFEKVKEERDQMKAALSSMGEGLLVIDKDQNITLMNQAAGVLLRVSLESTIGRKVEDVFRLFKHDEDTEEEQTGRLLMSLLDQPNIINIKLADNFYCKNETGDSFPVSVVMNSLYNKSHNSGGGIIVFKDVRREKEVDRAKNEFVSLASHQLQTPLASINWYTEALLSEQAGKIKEDQKKYLNQIYSSSKRMVELVNSLLNISRIELGHLAIEPEPLNLSEVVDSIFLELQSQIVEKKLKVEKSIPRDFPVLNLDARLARVIFQNLLSNAVKYSNEHGFIKLSVKNTGDYILISVEDSGCGIPKEDQYRIFTKLFRADNAREKIPEGNGLGLYIVKSILEQAGCKIWFKSDGENKGSTFFVSMPVGGMIKKEGTKKLT